MGVPSLVKSLIPFTRLCLVSLDHCSLNPELFRSSPLPVNIFQFCNVAKLRTLDDFGSTFTSKAPPPRPLLCHKNRRLRDVPKRLGRRGYIFGRDKRQPEIGLRSQAQLR